MCKANNKKFSDTYYNCDINRLIYLFPWYINLSIIKGIGKSIMKLSQLTNSTKIDIGVTAASAALTMESLAAAVHTPNIRTLPLAAIGVYLTVSLTSHMVRKIKQDARIRKEVLEHMENSQEMKDVMNPFK